MNKEELVIELSKLIDLDKDDINKWMNAPNSAFDGKKPIDCFDTGDLVMLGQALYRLKSGQPG